MHNHVRHTVEMPVDVNGFRAWTDIRPPLNVVKCKCGWSGLPHYRLSARKQKGLTAKQRARLDASDRWRARLL
jgi:hypothetical protein